MSRHKSTRYTILIVCEGSNTEPNYFKGIKEEVIAKKLWTEGVAIEIRPKPPLEEKDEMPEQSKHKSQRKRRQLKQVIVPEPLEEVEKEYRSVPVRYVREAQKGLEDGTYDEAWAVFDQDGHPRHEEAFELAETLVEGKKVNIAFSSISFEHWVLLHFEKNKTAFAKSECKDGLKKVMNCGSGTHKDDCYGGRCVAGYIRTCGYLTDYSKQANIDLYAALKELTSLAIENASWLRSQAVDLPVYSLNPYSDVDLLVKRLLKIEKDYIWLSIGMSWESNGIIIAIKEKDQKGVMLHISNQKDIAYVFNSRLLFCSKNEQLQQYEVESGIIEPNQSFVETISLDEQLLKLPEWEVRISVDDLHTLIFQQLQ